MWKIACAFVVFIFLVPCISYAKIINVQIKGVDNGLKTTKQQDYKEAALFAKREAIERAGVDIKSKSTVEDLMLIEDFIESKSEGILLPGYQIIDIGYDEDKIYNVVLVGKLRVTESMANKEVAHPINGTWLLQNDAQDWVNVAIRKKSYGITATIVKFHKGEDERKWNEFKILDVNFDDNILSFDCAFKDTKILIELIYNPNRKFMLGTGYWGRQNPDLVSAIKLR